MGHPGAAKVAEVRAEMAVKGRVRKDRLAIRAEEQEPVGAVNGEGKRDSQPLPPRT